MCILQVHCFLARGWGGGQQRSRICDDCSFAKDKHSATDTSPSETLTAGEAGGRHPGGIKDDRSL